MSHFHEIITSLTRMAERSPSLLSTAATYYHTQERRESHRNMKPRKKTGAELAKAQP